MINITQFIAAAIPVLLTMHAARKIKSWLGQTYGHGVELYIEDCLRVQGGRLAVYKEAEMNSARQIPDSPDGAISSQGGGLLIRLGFEFDNAAGAFIGKVRTWCEFRELTLRVTDRTETMVCLGKYITVGNYVETDTTSPPGAQVRARSRSSEASFASNVTEILDDKDAQCVYQSFEVADRWNQKDSCHLISHSECKNTPLDKDPSNRVAASTRVHRGLDGTSDKFPPWIRITVKNYDMNPVSCPENNGKVSNRFRVNLLIDFHLPEQKTGHGIAWKEGSKDDGVNPVETFVHVKNYETFVNGVEWKHKETTKIWDEIRSANS
eukprot:jgi/Undpi1/11665/HiC_scaffold_36.g13960.m1